MRWLTNFWLVLVSSFICSLAATALCKKIAIKFGIVDKPDNLVKTHEKPVAYLGGIGILIGLTVGILTSLRSLQDYEPSGVAIIRMLGILGGGVIACFIGLADDLFDIKPKHKIFGQILAAITLLLAGIKPNLYYITHPLNLSLPHSVETLLEVVIVIFFVVGATNSLNLLDGLDGLCGGVTVIITIAMLIVAIHLNTWTPFGDVNDSVRIIVCFGLIGTICGFLPFNRHPAKIFMGDAGSMLLGFMIATLMILFAWQLPRWWMASIVIFGLPILDTAVALARRTINHKPLFVSDRGHIYDQMIDRGIPLKKTVAICYMLASFYAAIGLIMSQIRTRYASVVYVIVFVVSGLIVWKKGYLKMKGCRGAIHKQPPTGSQQPA
jgi:UDP-GlcNAc:undecaprenyl-phosphate GlcNAc-1-phosphate transferase